MKTETKNVEGREVTMPVKRKFNRVIIELSTGYAWPAFLPLGADIKFIDGKFEYFRDEGLRNKGVVSLGTLPVNIYFATREEMNTLKEIVETQRKESAWERGRTNEALRAIEAAEKEKTTQSPASQIEAPKIDLNEVIKQ